MSGQSSTVAIRATTGRSNLRTTGRATICLSLDKAASGENRVGQKFWGMRLGLAVVDLDVTPAFERSRPHPPQNLSPGRFSYQHSSQTKMSFPPHCLQNFRVSRLSTWQFGHFILCPQEGRVEDRAFRRKENEGLGPWRIIRLLQEQDRTYLVFSP